MNASTQVLIIFPNGNVERGNMSRESSEIGDVRHGKPGYDWHQGFSAISAQGVSAPLTLSEWRAIAKRDGQRLITTNSQADAVRLLNPAQFNATAEKLKAALPSWHFEPYGVSGAVACFPPHSEGGTCAEAWHRLAKHAFIASVCGPLYVVTQLRENKPVLTTDAYDENA